MVEWQGGECPVVPSLVVSFRLRGGGEGECPAGRLHWKHRGSVTDIVAYRVVEIDPHGRDAHAKGAKLDAGKNRASLVLHGFARALLAVSEVGTYGANKYTDNGWCEVPNGIERYSDALYRHTLREAQGEQRDPDTGLLHAAHAAWNARARLDLMLREGATDDDQG